MKAAIYSFSLRGALLSKHIAEALAGVGYHVENRTIAKYAEAAGLEPLLPDYKVACENDFYTKQLLVFVGAVGIAVRTIANHVASKTTDPAVLSVDECGNFVIPLLAGHIGGANEMARELAAALGASACVTTATDVNGLFAVDEWAARNGMHLSDMKAAKAFAAELVHGNEVGLVYDEGMTLVGALPTNVIASTEPEVGMEITVFASKEPFKTTLAIYPRIVHLGIGCRRDTPLEKIKALVLPELAKLGIEKQAIASIASVDLKKDEQGLLAFAKELSVPANFYTASELEAVEGDFTPSKFVQSIVGVSNVCERSAVLAADGGELLLRKTSKDGVTLAVAVANLELDFKKTGLRTK